MRHRVHTFKVGRTSSHRRAMLANMVSSLIEHGQITTSLVKAKEARRVAEKMITLGKKGDIHRRRLAFATLHSRDIVKKLFDEVAPGYAERQGGYTSIIKLGKRQGDACEMCILKLVPAAVKAAEPEAKADAKAEEKAEEKAE